MSLNDWLKKNSFITLMVAAAVVLTLLLPAEGKFKYEYQRGRPWLYETLVAPMDIPVLKTEQELRLERSLAAKNTVNCFNYITGADEIASAGLISLLDRYAIEERAEISRMASFIYEKGVADRLPDTAKLAKILVQTPGMAQYEKAVGEVYLRENAIRIIKSLFGNSSPSDKELEEVLVPNLVFDKSATEIAHNEAMQRISPTKGILYTGEVIVARGETITAEIEQLLDSFRAEYALSMGFTGSFLLLKSGQFLIVAGIMLLLFVLLVFLKKELLFDNSKITFVLVLMIFLVTITIIVRDISPAFLYLIPYSVFALYLSSFFTSRIVVPVYLTMLLPVFLIAQNGIEIFMINAVAGSITVLAYSYWNRGWQQFAVSFAVFLTLTVIYSAYRLVEEGSLVTVNPTIIGYFVWNSLLIIAAFPLLYIFEKIFGLVSGQRLRELADADSPLLKLLSEKAPGTFQHSLQVANLAESAAAEIGANALLARVGGLYHDLGKMNNPLYFIENQPRGGENIHETLKPQDSAAIIIKHVEDGVSIAKKWRLPQIVTDFILTHHGHSRTLYFYRKFINSGGDPSEKELFTYKGLLPVYKEQAIVMMADAVEAASRSVRDYSEHSISELVERVVDERISEEQLAGSEISIRDIKRVKEAFKQKLIRVYHSRIVAPV